MGNIINPAGASRRAVLSAAGGALLTGVAASEALCMPQISQTSPDFELITLCAEFNMLQRKWFANFQTGESFEAEFARSAPNEAIELQQAVLLDQIFQIRAVTMEGVLARAQMALLYNPDLLNERRLTGWNDMMAAALIRDLAGETTA